MTKSQFLQSLETELKSRRLPDAGEILEEYEQHFAFKLADGYTEQEIARNLGIPFEIAAQFDPQSPKREAPGGRAAIIAGLGLASVPAAGFFLLLAGWGIIVACSSLVSLAVAACLLGGISPWGLIPAMPGGIAAVYGISMAALSVLSAAGCVYFAALFRQLVLACARCFKNAASTGPHLPPLPVVPRFSPKTKRVLRRTALLSLCVFAAFVVLGMALSMMESGSLGFWHAWGWFESGV